MKTLATKPPVNWIYVTVVAALGTTTVGFVLWTLMSQVYREWIQGRPISGGWNWPLVIALDCGCVAVLSALFWKIYCDANTEIGEEELCQRGILGCRRIRWAEVTRVDRVGFGYHVFSETEKIVLTPYAYADPDSVVAALLTRIEGAKRSPNRSTG